MNPRTERKKIVLLSGNHVCHNPRTFKEAETLAAAGYDVEWIGAWLNPGLTARDKNMIAGRAWRFTPAVDLSTIHGKQKTGNWPRARRWLGRKKFELLGWENSDQLGYCGPEMLALARQCKADLYIAHSEPAMWAAEKLARLGHRVGLDMEDWFSQDLPSSDRKARPLQLLHSLEAKLLREGAHATCTSLAMSKTLASEYGCRPPTVLYNAFPWSDRQKLDGQFKDRKDRSLPSIHWYSQTIGHGRGLEDLLTALPRVTHPAEIHLRGDMSQDFSRWFQAHVPEAWRERIFLHEQVSNEDLLSRIAEHDIGFAGEIKNSRNHDLTVSNKVLHYMLGGLAVVASDTAGQCEISQQAGEAVSLYPAGHPQALAEALNALLASPEKLKTAKSAALAAAEETFCWELQARVLLATIANVFAR